MRSLHVITSPARRGAETFAVHLVEELQRQGLHARLVALHTATVDEVYPVEVLGPARRAPRTLRELRRHARDADVVVAHGSSTLEACATALAGTGVPFVYRSIGDPGHWSASAPSRRLLSALHRRATRHVALWQDAAATLSRIHRLDPDRIDVIGNGVPSARWKHASTQERRQARTSLDVSPERTCLAYVGALSPEKQVSTVLDVVRALPDAQVLVAGSGPEATALRRTAEAISPSRIRFLGNISDVRSVYAAADLLLLPSRTEGMPAVVIEAGLVGTATVATDAGALPEMISRGENGFLCPQGDPEAFIELVRSALPVSAVAGERAAQDFHRRYGIEHITQRWMYTLYRAVETQP